MGPWYYNTHPQRRPKTKNPDNYRGICIGSSLMKVLSTLMNHRLIKLRNRKNLINHEQTGFKANSRTADHIIALKSIVNKYVTDQNGKKIYSCFIDLRKAFDTVWLNGLFHKLEHMNIGGNFHH